jgi:hypothetical protein
VTNKSGAQGKKTNAQASKSTHEQRLLERMWGLRLFPGSAMSIAAKTDPDDS